MSSIDVAREWRATPGCENVVHPSNAGASLMPDVVLATMIEHLELEAQIGGYEVTGPGGRTLRWCSGDRLKPATAAIRYRLRAGFPAAWARRFSTPSLGFGSYSSSRGPRTCTFS